MQQRSGVVSAGTWCVDLNKQIAEWPAEDTANEILAIDRQGGGAGCNMALDLRRLDPTLPVRRWGRSATTTTGDFCSASATLPASIGRGFACSTARRRNASTRSASAAAGGEPISSIRASPRCSAPIISTLRRPPRGCCTSACPARIARWTRRGAARPTAGSAVLKAARAAGLETNLELMTIERERLAALAAPCLPWLDFLIVNDFEIGAVAGVATRAEGSADAAAIGRAIDAVFARSALKLIAVHFPEGALVGARDGSRLAIGSVAIPADQIVSVNGAGDGFAAGFLYGLHEEWSVERCAALAHASAAASMRAISTTAGVSPWTDCLALARRWGYRDAPR